MKLNQLIDNHWKYVQKILTAHGVTEVDIYSSSTHYKTAFAHGYKHAIEDVLNATKLSAKDQKKIKNLLAQEEPSPQHD